MKHVSSMKCINWSTRQKKRWQKYTEFRLFATIFAPFYTTNSSCSKCGRKKGKRAEMRNFCLQLKAQNASALSPQSEAETLRHIFSSPFAVTAAVGENEMSQLLNVLPYLKLWDTFSQQPLCSSAAVGENEMSQLLNVLPYLLALLKMMLWGGNWFFDFYYQGNFVLESNSKQALGGVLWNSWKKTKQRPL